MVGESLPLGAEDALEQALMPYARDVNGDGQVVIRVDPLVFDGSQMLEQTNNGKLFHPSGHRGSDVLYL